MDGVIRQGNAVMRRVAKVVPLVGLVMALCAIGIGVATAQASKAPAVSTSEKGLSDAQRNQIYQASWNQFKARYQKWLIKQNLSSLQWHNLRREVQAASYVAPSARTFAQAVGSADEVVTGTVVGAQPTPSFDTLVTFQVTRWYKGGGSPTLMIRQTGGLRPTLDWSGAFLVDSLDQPLMLPGEQYLLLLQHGQTSAEFNVESFTGMYKIQSGKLGALATNPFASRVNGAAVENVSTLIP
jgi:hypothetical protein